MNEIFSKSFWISNSFTGSYFTIDKGFDFNFTTRCATIEKAIEKFVLRFKKIDGLVNCGYPRTKDWGNNFENTTFLSFKKNVEYQLSQIFTISKLAIKIMKTQNQGSIVNIGSIYGTLGNDFSLYENSEINPQVTYSAIKGGLIGLNNFLTSYCGQFNIRSNIVSPGGVFDNQNKDFVKKYKSKVPLKRMAKPSDISPIVCFLLSDDSEYITGQNILVDGGFSKI